MKSAREQTRDDRRDTRHNVDEEGDAFTEGLPPPGLGVLHEEDGGQKTDGDRDDRSPESNDERSDDGVENATAVSAAVEALHVSREEARREQARPAFREHLEEEGYKRNHRSGKGANEDERHEAVLRPSLTFAHSRVDVANHEVGEKAQDDDGRKGEGIRDEQEDRDEYEGGDAREYHVPPGQAALASVQEARVPPALRAGVGGIEGCGCFTHF